MMVTSACRQRLGGDSAPVMPEVPTFYDVDSLSILYHPRAAMGTTPGLLQAIGLVP